MLSSNINCNNKINIKKKSADSASSETISSIKDEYPPTNNKICLNSNANTNNCGCGSDNNNNKINSFTKFPENHCPTQNNLQNTSNSSLNNTSQYYNPNVNSFINIVTINLMNDKKPEDELNNGMGGGNNLPLNGLNYLNSMNGHNIANNVNNSMNVNNNSKKGLQAFPAPVNVPPSGVKINNDANRINNQQLPLNKIKDINTIGVNQNNENNFGSIGGNNNINLLNSNYSMTPDQQKIFKMLMQQQNILRAGPQLFNSTNNNYGGLAFNQGQQINSYDQLFYNNMNSINPNIGINNIYNPQNEVGTNQKQRNPFNIDFEDYNFPSSANLKREFDMDQNIDEIFQSFLTTNNNQFGSSNQGNNHFTNNQQFTNSNMPHDVDQVDSFDLEKFFNKEE
jgi:hypothetical protein